MKRILDWDHYLRTAAKAAAEGIVMLRNELCREHQQKCCPLPASAKIALMGTHDGELLVCGGGSACVWTDRNTNLLTELRKRFADVRIGLYDEADTLIYVVSIPGQEGNDRKTLAMNPEEQARIRKLRDYAKENHMRKVLLVNAAGPATGLAIGYWDAAFWVSLPGMQGAAALADILCGKVNPSGRLPVSFPYSDNDMPSYLNFPGDGMTVMYGEGIFVGYRYYTTRYHFDQDDQFAEYVFGFGLSYSEFEVRNLRVESGSIETGLDLLADVENTGDVGGKTVV